MSVNEGKMATGRIATYAGLSGDKLLYAVVAIATCGFSLFGYDQGLMSGIIASRQFNTEFPGVSSHLANCEPIELMKNSVDFAGGCK